MDCILHMVNIGIFVRDHASTVIDCEWQCTRVLATAEILLHECIEETLDEII